MSQGAASRRWKRQGTDSPLEHPEAVQPCRHLGFNAVKLILDFLVSRTVAEHISVVLNCRVYGTLLQQPQETNTLAFNPVNPWWLKVRKGWYSKSARSSGLANVRAEERVILRADCLFLLF